jgi:hypothetical protein
LSVKKSIKIDDYEKGLLIHVITAVISSGNSFSQDDLEKLKDIKKRLQSKNGVI